MVRWAVIAAIITLALMIFSIIGSLPKWAWLVIIIFVPAIGSLAWIIAGRPKGNGRGRRKRKIVPPDDNPDFLGKL
jgi:hypothetical protein